MSNISKRHPVDILALAGKDTFVKNLGIHVIEASPGRVVTRLVVEERHLNFNGVVQGGLTFTLADTAFGYASNSHGIMAGGIDAHIVYLEPVRMGDVLTATAAEISRSRRLLNYRVDVTRSDGVLVSKMSATALMTEKPIVGQL
jgi:phenylacetic acid degradation protein PaaD